MTYLTRADWGAAKPTRTLTPLTPSRVDYWTLHYDGSTAIGLRDPRALMRSFQRYHQQTHGWTDIAYNSACFQNGDRAEGRGPAVGGHILADQNPTSWGCIAAIGVTEKPTPALLAALRDDYAAACAWAGKTLIARGHTDWPDANKPCPGTYLKAWLRTGGHLLDEATTRALQGRAGARVDGVLLDRDSCKAVQAYLGVTPDGVWGSQTTRALQQRVGATVDGIWGASTVAKLRSYLEQLTTTKPSIPIKPSPAPDAPEPTDPQEDLVTVNDLLDAPLEVSWGKTTVREALTAAAELHHAQINGVPVRLDNAIAELVTGNRKILARLDATNQPGQEL